MGAYLIDICIPIEYSLLRPKEKNPRVSSWEAYSGRKGKTAITIRHHSVLRLGEGRAGVSGERQW